LILSDNFFYRQRDQLMPRSDLHGGQTMRSYVYVLLDAVDGTPFFIGVHTLSWRSESGLVLTVAHLQALLDDRSIELIDMQRNKLSALLMICPIAWWRSSVTASAGQH